MTNNKTCTRCKESKPIVKFYTDTRSWCNDCERETRRKGMREYNATFRGKAAQALNGSRRAVNKVEGSEGITIENTLTLHDVLFILASKDCAYCGQEISERDRTIDHITPMKHGAGNTFDNVVMACDTCNKAKNDLPVITYMLQSVDGYEATQLIDRIGLRSNKKFIDVFKELADYAKTYYEIKTIEAIERIEASEGGDVQT